MNQTKEKAWEHTLAEKFNAVFLVRSLLGCTCPEEIFDYYQVRQKLKDLDPKVHLHVLPDITEGSHR